MRLLEDWKDVLTKAWSVRLMVVAALLSGMEVALPFMVDIISIPRGSFAALSGITTAAAFVARLVAQKGLSE
jgi:hypothetical protein